MLQRTDRLSGAAAVEAEMAKNIVLCSDGTGNAFDERATNVSKLIRSIDLRCSPEAERPQIAFYDQGVGTNPGLIADAKAYSKSRPVAQMLTVLPKPHMGPRVPGWLARLRGLVDGYGLKQNLKELVRSLADNHKENDSIYLFGFSRGAFTVRAVAGFVHRCGLPNECESFDEWFTDGFALYSEHFPPAAAIESFRERSRRVEIDFLGVWDTVKSYGGLVPISWPHLRHNPSVKVVRHALALNEERAWFQHTTWGYVNEKLCGEPLEPDERYRFQDVEEVWFRGYHSDIGGGKKEAESAQVALLWMLGDAAHFGLRLNDDGKALFDKTSDFDREIDTHDSYPWWWPAVGLIPRQELHNDCRPPRRSLAIGGRARRDPLLPEPRDPQLPRQVLVHVSALGAVHLQQLRAVRTRALAQ
jgi:uncharacterized protein (DUF2235 family)